MNIIRYYNQKLEGDMVLYLYSHFHKTKTRDTDPFSLNEELRTGSNVS